MIITIAIVLTCLVGLLALFFYVRHGAAEVHSPEQLSALAEAIDMQSFLNLVDHSEVEYLRSRLSHRDFQSLERKRSLVLVDYVSRVSHNASLLIGFAHYLGEDQQQSRQLLAAALNLRAYSTYVIALLYLKYLLPGTTIPVPK